MLTKKPPSAKTETKNTRAARPSAIKTEETLFTEQEIRPTPPKGDTVVSKPVSSISPVTKPNVAPQPAITRVVVKYDVGFSNTLSIRGKGANLSWEKGIPLVNNGSDEWIWETRVAFTQCEFKILINDTYYEKGENHPLRCGASFQFTPQF